MIVIGLTGATGAGKSTLATCLRRKGWPIFDADAVVRTMQTRGGVAIPAIRQVWPDVVVDGAVDRARLRRYVTADQGALSQLEAIMHPLVGQARMEFIRNMRQAHQRVCVLDIPLLVETGAYLECDYIIVVKAPLATRYHRIKMRGGMSRSEASVLMNRQASDQARHRVADVEIQSGLSRAFSVLSLKRALMRWGL